MRRLLAATISAILGLGLGAALAFGGQAAMRPTIAILLGAAVGLCVSALVRQPAWRHETMFESLGRAILGGGLGAALLYGATQQLPPWELPFVLGPLPPGTRLLEHPLLVGPLAGLLLGLLFGIAEPTPEAAAKPSDTPKPASAPKPPATAS